ncbi:putative helicase MAGATAMA 3 [Haematococcus lacustris]|uniref:Putative helicase MAGATAMA 3 n=1 Tax=Haematococcus lacustris TaxID=44745 RepID=A0A699ZLR3_HAELA|nr:putative helicase MAGATAMA 3 [Haematococcus lacustris]
MTPEAQAELRAALDRDTELNRAQRNNLQQAAARSLTLMQGPPGTGKSAALVSMVKALCRVFHCPTVRPDRPFMVATNLPMAEWSSAQLLGWLQSFSPELVNTEQKSIIIGALQARKQQESGQG